MTSPDKKRSSIAGAIVIAGVLLSCITALLGYDILPDYQDKLFHLRRLAALAQTLNSGYFPARIYFVMNSGTGYALPVFYPDLFLYVPAFLVNIGVPLGIAYDVYVIGINLITGIVTYLSVKGILKGDKIIAAVISFVYVLSVYRLTDVYIRDAVGEYTAMAFLPFVIYSFVRVYRDEDSGEGIKGILKNASYLGLSMAILSVSHILTTMMTAGFLFVSAVIMIKKTVKKNVFLTLVLSVMIFLGLAAYNLVPMIDYMLSDRYLVNESSNIMRGFYPGWRDLLEIIPSGSGSGIVYEMKMPTAVGPAITAILAAWFVRTIILFIRRLSSKDKKSVFYPGFNAELVLFVITGLSLFISSKYFPWTKIEQSGGILRSVFCSVQFSWRYLGTASVCACILGAYLIRDIYISSKTAGRIFGCLIVIIAVIPGIILQTRACSENNHVKISKGEEIGIVSDELYFPVSWNRDAVYDEKPAAAGCEVVSYARVGGDWIVDVKDSSEGAVVVFPVVYYKGYTAQTESGDKLSVMQGTDGRVMVILPAGLNSQIKMGFKEPARWKFAETVSLIVIVFVSLLLIIRRKTGGD